eukprot:gene53235-71172_t
MTDPVRIDKWLWAARFFKTRSLATDAVDGGKVRLNGERCKPARNLHIGDLLDIDNGGTLWQVRVAGLSGQRGPAPVARSASIGFIDISSIASAISLAMFFCTRSVAISAPGNTPDSV